MFKGSHLKPLIESWTISVQMFPLPLSDIPRWVGWERFSLGCSQRIKELWFVSHVLVIWRGEKKKSIFKSIEWSFAQTALLNKEWAFHKTRLRFWFRSLTTIPIRQEVPSGKGIFTCLLCFGFWPLILGRCSFPVWRGQDSMQPLHICPQMTPKLNTSVSTIIFCVSLCSGQDADFLRLSFFKTSSKNTGMRVSFWDLWLFSSCCSKFYLILWYQCHRERISVFIERVGVVAIMLGFQREEIYGDKTCVGRLLWSIFLYDDRMGRTVSSCSFDSLTWIQISWLLLTVSVSVLCVCVCVCVLSHVWLLVTPWIGAHQAPPSIGFPRQE